MPGPTGPRPAGTLLVLILGLGILLPACDGDAGDSGSPSEDVVVLAAASLADAFGELSEAFTAAEATGGDVSVALGFAASSRLAAQIVEGAPADVFASADQHHMEIVTEAGRAAGEPLVFARNRMEIVVAPGNPRGITGLDDLDDEDLVLVVCAPQAPCGRYADQIAANAGVTLRPDSFEENPRAVLTKVVLGEADAGIVYATDVRSAGDRAEGVEIPVHENVEVEYPIVVTADAAAPDRARAFVEFVTSETGRQILEGHGFSVP